MRKNLLILILTLAGVMGANSLLAQISFTWKIKEYNGVTLSCHGANDAEITILAKGGSGSYEFSKDEGKTWQKSNIFSKLAGGRNYVAKVRDAVNNSIVSEPAWIWVADVNPVTVNTFQRDSYYNDGGLDGISCVYNKDGKITIQAHGGAGNYTFSIDGGKTFTKSNLFTGLGAGTYTGMVKDGNGCIATANWQATITSPEPIEVVILEEKIADEGQNNGYLRVKGKGGNGGFNLYVDGERFSDNGNHWINRDQEVTIKNLSAKEYKLVMVNEGSGSKCTSDPIAIVLNPIKATLSGSASICPGSTTSLNLSIKATKGTDFTATYKNKKGSIFTIHNLKAGESQILLKPIFASEEFTLISVLDETNYSGFASGSAIITIKNNYTWLGKTKEWQNTGNWSCNIVPTLKNDVTIPMTENDPVLILEGNEARNLTVKSGAVLTVSGALKLAGNITASSSVIVTTGKVDFAGTKSQQVSGKVFKDKTVYHLQISNASGLTVNSVSGDTLNITGKLTFGTETAKLFTGNNITLKSGVNGTANLGKVGENNKITGTMTVEKFINLGLDPALHQHTKAWMLLATPTKGQTIRDSWQEGAVSTGKTPILNPNKGYGTLLTTGYNHVPANGFDLYTGPGPSIKNYNSATNTFDKGPASTLNQLYNPKGYLILVRGDRSVFTYNAPPVSTILRSTGEVITGTTDPIVVGKDKFESIGNPYPAAIRLDKIHKEDLDDIFYVWDPLLGGSLGLGQYQTLYGLNDGTYIAIPGGGSYSSGFATHIESGNGFFVHATGKEGSIRFTEDAKTIDEPTILRTKSGNDRMEIKSLLYSVSGPNTVLTDGNLIQFDASYSNEIDALDARKLTNNSENFSIYSNAMNLAVERRKPLTENDTIFFRLTGVRVQAYQFEISAANLTGTGVEAFLEDVYKGTKTQLNMHGKTVVSFQIENNTGSYAANRFRIVLKAAMAPLPVTVTTFTAAEKENDILVRWTVENELNVSRYVVQKSFDGKIFFHADEVRAAGKAKGAYQWLDKDVKNGYNYYRLKSVDFDGKESVSAVVKVLAGKAEAAIGIYPNPVTGGKVNLEIKGGNSGVYYYRVINPLGQTTAGSKFSYSGGNHRETIHWNIDNPQGNYRLEITNPQGETTSLNFVY